MKSYQKTLAQLYFLMFDFLLRVICTFSTFHGLFDWKMNDLEFMTVQQNPDKNNLLLQMSKIQETLKLYAYNAAKPTFSAHPLSVYDAESKESGLKFTLKLYRRADADLTTYFQKMKSAASDYLIKFYQIINEPETSQLLVIQEYVPYGTLASALSKTKRLEDQDALNITKQILNGHIDMLRTGLCWSGTEADIDITENGVKLSWNNSMIYSENNPNPFPELIERIATRKDQTGVLPFPPNKMIGDLIKVSRQNASEMSLHPLLKKRDKVFKKKGKNWIAIKEFKAKGEYSQELAYTAVSKEYGLVRVKMFEKGDVDQNLIKIYQTKPSFTKILEYYEEGSSFITISEYANDGSVQSYIKRLKASNIQLKQNHIQFIFFSLIEPLKFINASPVVSFNLLHIKNIYIENGIPKIGEIMPINETIKEILQEKADIPDFYHREFKQMPSSKDAKFDTYSLGVLLYKLMYTEYPIFPEGTVHIPTTPSYKKTLKDALLLFLQKGGNLLDLENELQVSDDIKNQVKQNEQLLNNGTKKTGALLVNEERNINQFHSELSIGEEEERKAKENQKKDCLGKLWDYLNTRGKDTEGKYRRMHLSQFAFYRKCTLVFLVLTLYFLTFFLPYIIGFFNLINNTRLFYPVTISILGQNHRFVAPNYDIFINAVNSLGTITSLSQVTDGLQCALDDNGTYFDFLKPTSPHWYLFLTLSFITMVIILLLKGMQTSEFNLVKTFFHYYDETIDGANESRFALSSYVFFQLWYFMCLYTFFYLFNIIFLEQHTPCFGGKNWSQLTATLFTDRIQFSQNYLIILLAAFFMGILSFIQINNAYSKISYNSLLNPIFIYTPCYIALFVMMRIGAYGNFSPSFMSNSQGLIGSSYANFIGYFPELLYLAELLIELLVNLAFYKIVDKRIETYVLTDSISDEIKN